MKYLYNISILLIFLLVGCSDIKTIKIPPKSMQVSDNLVYFEGRWNQVAGEKGIIPRVNFVTVTCKKNEMLCIEIQSKLLMPEESDLIDKPLLFSDSFEYPIIKWDNSVIIAERKPRVADVDIRISLKDESVEKNFRETKARGSKTANPDFFGKWILL